MGSLSSLPPAPAAPAVPFSKLSPGGNGWPDANPFWYPINPPQLAANQQGVQASLQLDTDKDFIWDRIFATCQSGGITGVSVYLQDASRGVTLLGNGIAPVFLENLGAAPGAVAGPAQAVIGGWLPKPYRLQKGTILAGTFNNRTAVVTNVAFCLVGRKVD